MMDISHQEGNDRSPFGCFTEYTYMGDFFQTLQSVSCQFMLMGGYLFNVMSVHIIKGFCQSGSSDIVGRTGFKLEGQSLKVVFSKDTC